MITLDTAITFTKPCIELVECSWLCTHIASLAQCQKHCWPITPTHLVPSHVKSQESDSSISDGWEYCSGSSSSTKWTNSNVFKKMLCRHFVMAMTLHLTALVVGCCQRCERSSGFVSNCNVQAILGHIFSQRKACARFRKIWYLCLFPCLFFNLPHYWTRVLFSLVCLSRNATLLFVLWAFSRE